MACRACSGLNPSEHNYCENCGTPLGATRVRGHLTDSVDRRVANRNLGRAWITVAAFRRLYGILAFALVLGQAFRWGLFAWLADRGDLPPFDARFALEATLVGALFVLYIVGACRVSGEPLVWSMILALLQTLMAVLSFDGVALTLAVLCWGGVTALAPVSRLLREHPDLRIASRFRGKRRRIAHGTVAAISRARDEQERIRFRRRATLVMTAALLTSCVSVAGWVMFARKPAPILPTVHTFVSCWNTSRLTQIPDFIDEAVRDRYAKNLEVIVERNGWIDDWPTLGEPEVHRADDDQSYDVFFPLGSGKVTTRWEYRDGSWAIVRIRVRGS